MRTKDMSAEVIDIASALPQMKTVADLELLEYEGFEVRDKFFDELIPRRLQHKAITLGFFNRALLDIAGSSLDSGQSDADEIKERSIKCSKLAIGLILQPPEGIEVNGRNPKQEFPSMARLLMYSAQTDTPVPFVVPCCPDNDKYRLGDGLGRITPKGLGYCSLVQQFFGQYGFNSSFDVQIADVEGLDPLVLDITGETSESHFRKTDETIRKAQEEARNNPFISVGSMLSAFEDAGVNYLNMQAKARAVILGKDDKRVERTLEDLTTERLSLGDFERIGVLAKRALVIAELAGYASYGAMVAGKAIILSPDAKSAIPAYHYSVNNPAEYSPVFYAK